MYDNPWIYDGKPFESDMIGDYIGFVYLITHKKTKKKYIGKKLFHMSKTRMVNKKKKRYKVESNWKDYYGSSEALNDHVDLYGAKNFKREILRLCKTKGECSYFEAKEQFVTDAIISEEYYNTWVAVKVRRNHLKL